MKGVFFFRVNRAPNPVWFSQFRWPFGGDSPSHVWHQRVTPRDHPLYYPIIPFLALWNHLWLVVWNILYFSLYIYGIILPIDFHMFQGGYIKPPTRYFYDHLSRRFEKNLLFVDGHSSDSQLCVSSMNRSGGQRLQGSLCWSTAQCVKRLSDGDFTAEPNKPTWVMIWSPQNPTV